MKIEYANSGIWAWTLAFTPALWGLVIGTTLLAALAIWTVELVAAGDATGVCVCGGGLLEGSLFGDFRKIFSAYTGQTTIDQLPPLLQHPPLLSRHSVSAACYGHHSYTCRWWQRPSGELSREIGVAPPAPAPTPALLAPRNYVAYKAHT